MAFDFARAAKVAVAFGLAGSLAACGGGEGTGGQGGTSSTTTPGTGGAGGTSTGTGGAAAHSITWARTFLGSQQSATSVATDAQGNIYVGGTFSNGTVDFGAGQHDCPTAVMVNNWCGFLLKLDPTGKTLWSRAFVADKTASIDVPAIGVGPDGVVIAATWQRFQLQHAPLDLGTGPLDPPGDNPMVLARFDPTGKPLWSAAYGDDSGEVLPASVIVDAAGSFVVGGGFTTASLDLGAGPMPYITDHTLFLARFVDTSVGWQKSFGSATGLGQDLGGVAHLPSGGWALAGDFDQGLDLGASSPLTAAGRGLFTAALDANGAAVSDQAHATGGTLANVTGVAADAAGSTIVTGLFDSTLSVSGSKTLTCQGDFNGYLAKLDAKGAPVFTQVNTDVAAAIDGSFRVATDPSNNVLWGANLSFSTETEDYSQGSITKLGPDGAMLWSHGGKYFGVGGVAVDAGGNVIVVGQFSKELALSPDAPIAGTTGFNAFVSKLAP